MMESLGLDAHPSKEPGYAAWLVSPLEADVKAALQRLLRADDVQYVAVMPDVHLASEICIGTVVATSHLIYPNAVGGDIGCGMAAICTDVEASLLDDEGTAAKLLKGLYHCIPANRHGRDSVVEYLPDGLEDEGLSSPALEKYKRREGRWQFGTLGRGNHFLELQRDREDRLWIMVHSGSRAMGQAIRGHHLSNATIGAMGMPCLDARQPKGEAYLNDAQWALKYAMASRAHMLAETLSLLDVLLDASPIPDTYLNMHHNHVVQEQHFGHRWWVHRKGANAAGDGVACIIPGSMGTESFLARGRGLPASLASSSHGAGRALHRTEARRRISTTSLAKQLDGVWFDHRKMRTLVDEAPAAYKDIRAVMRAQRELVCIEEILTPVLSYKA